MVGITRSLLMELISFLVINGSSLGQVELVEAQVGVGGLQYLYANTSPAIQQRAVKDLIARLIPARQSDFVVRINSSLTGSPYQDAFTVEYDNLTKSGWPAVVITGTTGVAAAYGLNHYLKYTCNVQVSWEGVQGLDSLPLPLPPAPSKLSTPVPLLDRFRYYLNACTESYSMAWWNWTRYEREIDWMALHGVNLPLVALGQEAIWWRLYRTFGLTEDEISRFVTGPAFLAWWRMGNLQRWGGPMPTGYMNAKLQLLRGIVTRMKEFGMLPVLPAFSGTVPGAIHVRFPNASVTQRGSWSHFNATYSPWFLEPTDPLFAQISSAFIKELDLELGVDQVRIYSCDTFNENRPSQNDTSYLKEVSRATYDSMRGDGTTPVVWIMQAWVFNYDRNFWSADNVRAYLRGVDAGNLVLLDLMADANPAYIRFDSFYGHSFIWCMLQNFGGASVLYGTMELINVGIPVARNVSRPGSMIGLGMAPEGIEQNYVMYDFMSDAAVFSNLMVDTKTWVTNYALRRYGAANGTQLLQRAWLTLESGVYNAFPWIRSNSHTILSGRPGLNRTEEHWYKLQDIVCVLGDFVSAADTDSKMNELFRYDLVDITRQFLQHTTELVYVQVLQAYFGKNGTEFKFHANRLLDVLDDLDLVLCTHSAFMTGAWVKSAEIWGQSDEERDLLRFNALNQISLWGPSGEIVDYAAKQWSGLIAHYVRPRWELFLKELSTALGTGKPFNEKKYNRNVLAEVEVPFTNLPSDVFPSQPSSDSLTEARRIYRKWKPVFDLGFKASQEFTYVIRERGRGQHLIQDKKRYQKWLKRKQGRKQTTRWNRNKKLARYYLKHVTGYRLQTMILELISQANFTS